MSAISLQANMTTDVSVHVLFLGRAELLQDITLEGVQLTVVQPSEASALPLVVNQPPDLIFLERGQPFTLSLETTSVPVIIITETDSEGKAAIAAGAADYIL